MPIAQLSAQSQEFAVNNLYRELYGMRRPPNDLVNDNGQEIILEDRLNELLILFEQNQGQFDQGRFILENPESGEIGLSNAERIANLRTPFTDFQTKISTSTIEKMTIDNVSVFHAFMARNNLTFKDDNVIDKDELDLAKIFVTELQKEPNKNIENIRDNFKAVVERKEALEVKEIAHKFSILAFAKDKYDDKYDLDSGSISFENGTMNNTTQEYLHGMLRQANDQKLLDKYVGEGKEFANKWDMRDAMYSKNTPYNYESDVPNAELSTKGMEILADLTTKMGLDLRVTTLKQNHIKNTVILPTEQEEIILEKPKEEAAPRNPDGTIPDKLKPDESGIPTAQDGTSINSFIGTLKGWWDGQLTDTPEKEANIDRTIREPSP